jgi:DNA-binding NtrC family response regulator
MSGLALFDKLIERGLADSLPVIFLTGHADVPTAVEAVKRGAFDFCEKPFSDNALVDRIEQALAQSARTLEATAPGHAAAGPAGRADRARARRDAAGGRGPAQQADRRPAGHQRAHGGGAPRAGVRQDGSEVGRGAG